MNTPHWMTCNETTKRLLSGLCVLPLFALGSCGDNVNEGEDPTAGTDSPTAGTDPGGTTTGDTDPGTGTGTGTGGAGGTSTDGATAGTAGETDGPPPPPGPAARGIRVTDIMINQGIQSELVLDGTFVGQGQRTAVIIGGRGGVIQAFWELAADFSPRDIEARLTIYDAGGAPLAEYAETKTISGPPGGLGSLEGAFSWVLEGTDFPGDGGFSVEFFEVGQDGVGADTGHRFPAEGSQPIEPDGSDLVWDVVVITTADCSTTMEMTDDRKGHFTQLITNNFPVATVNLELRETPEAGLGCSSQNYSGVRNVRDRDAFGPSYFYVGAILGEQWGGKLRGPESGVRSLRHGRQSLVQRGLSARLGRFRNHSPRAGPFVPTLPSQSDRAVRPKPLSLPQPLLFGGVGIWGGGRPHDACG